MERTKVPEKSTEEKVNLRRSPGFGSHQDNNSLRVSVIVPALNEGENLAHVLPLIPIWVHEVVLVDGRSTDNTVEEARRCYPGIRVVTQEGRGKGAALRTGFSVATGDIVVHLDADGSTDPTEIPAFISALLSGADFAKGSRFIQGGGTSDMTPLRKLSNWSFVTLVNLLFKTRYTDITYGYNATWRCHSHLLALEIDGWANEIISNIRAARHGLRVVEVASFEHCRIAGQAKLMTFSAGWVILKAILKEAFKKVEPRTETIGPVAEPRRANFLAAYFNLSRNNSEASLLFQEVALEK